MKSMSKETKEIIIKKALNQPHRVLKEIAGGNNIGYSTLQRWLRKYRSNTLNPIPTIFNKNNALSKNEKLEHLLATASLNENELGVYCRERGIYALQLSEWKTEMTKVNDEKKYQELFNETKLLRVENKKLKQDINRKNQALAETSALLILKKKADLIWGELGDS